MGRGNATNPSAETTDELLRGVAQVEGYRVLGPCLLGRPLGRGGMGAVYAGLHLNLEIPVACKVLASRLLGDEDMVRRFRREARVAASISSENLVRVFDVGSRGDLHFLVMELVSGETLRQRVVRKGALSEAEALTLGLGMARGLSVAHRNGVVHRDLKPDNVMIATDGTPKIADLGLAKAKDAMDTLATQSDFVIGTPAYMPPEQYEGAAKVGPAGDLWALGATLWYALTGANAMSGESLPELMRMVCFEEFPKLREHRSGLLTPTYQLVEELTRRSPGDRPPSAEIVAQRIEDLLVDLGRGDLADPEGLAGAEAIAACVSPPPQTLARIRAALDTASEWQTEPATPSAAPNPVDETAERRVDELPATRVSTPPELAASPTTPHPSDTAPSRDRKSSVDSVGETVTIAGRKSGTPASLTRNFEPSDALKAHDRKDSADPGGKAALGLAAAALVGVVIGSGKARVSSDAASSTIAQPRDSHEARESFSGRGTATGTRPASLGAFALVGVLAAFLSRAVSMAFLGIWVDFRSIYVESLGMRSPLSALMRWTVDHSYLPGPIDLALGAVFAALVVIRETRMIAGGAALRLALFAGFSFWFGINLFALFLFGITGIDYFFVLGVAGLAAAFQFARD